MPRPVRFTVRDTTDHAPRQAAEAILDLDNWSTFEGWGPLPGIKSAEYIKKTETIVGTQFRVTNTDGSGHIEEIIEWAPDTHVIIKMHTFPFPLRALATHFVETFRYTPEQGRTIIDRHFELHPTSPLAVPSLMLIGWMLKKAIAKHSKSWNQTTSPSPA